MDRSIEGRAIVRRAYDIYVTNAAFLLGAGVVVVAVVGGLGALVGVVGALALPAAVVDIFAIALFAGVLVGLVADMRAGSPARSPGLRLRAVKPVLGKLILVGILAGLAITLCFSLGPILLVLLLLGAAFAVPLGGIPLGVVVGFGAGVLVGSVILLMPGMFLMTRWAVALPTVVLERPAGLGALGRSADLVWGNRWRVFWLVVLVSVFAVVLNGTISLLAGLAGADARNLATALVTVLIAPIPVIVSTVLYFELLDAAPLADPSS